MRYLSLAAVFLLGACTTSLAPAAPDTNDAEAVANLRLSEVDPPFSDATRHLNGAETDIVLVRAGLRETVPLKPADLYPYVLRVSEISAFYSSGKPEDLRARNALVRQLFLRFRNDRWPEIRRHQVYQSKYTWCKNSRRGRTKRCDDEIRWDDRYKVIPASMWDTDRHFKEGPAIAAPNVIAWVIGRAGKGTNDGTVGGTAEFTDAAIDSQIEADKTLLRQALRQRGLPDDTVIDP